MELSIKNNNTSSRMKYLAVLIILMFLVACTIQPKETIKEPEQTPKTTIQQTKQPVQETKQEIVVKEIDRKYGIELKYSGLRDESNLLCASFYAEDISKITPVEGRDPNSWFAYAYLAPKQTLSIPKYSASKNELELSWSNKYCFDKSEIPPEFVDQEVRVLYSTSTPEEVLEESYLNILDNDNRKTFAFKDIMK